MLGCEKPRNLLALKLIVNPSVRVYSVHNFECRYVKEQIDDDCESDWREEDRHA